MPIGEQTLSPFARIPRANVLGVGVHAINPETAVELVKLHLDHGGKGYVCVTGVHGIMEAQQDKSLLRILNHARLVVPDGMPTVWVGHLQGHRTMSRVFGPDLMIDVCKASLTWGTKHYLCGGASGVAEQLQKVLIDRFPGLQIVGTYTPPFRPLTRDEQRELIDQIAKLRPDIVWVGLSTPKQEVFMAEYLPLLDTKLMLGVGAAFDLHTGRIKDCDDWIKRAGLQWLHRLFQEPRRLWRRYLVNNPIFIARISRQLLGLRKYALESN